MLYVVVQHFLYGWLLNLKLPDLLRFVKLLNYVYGRWLVDLVVKISYYGFQTSSLHFSQFSAGPPIFYPNFVFEE